jgi:hypothetical protein
MFSLGSLGGAVKSVAAGFVSVRPQLLSLWRSDGLSEESIAEWLLTHNFWSTLKVSFFIRWQRRSGVHYKLPDDNAPFIGSRPIQYEYFGLRTHKSNLLSRLAINKHSFIDVSVAELVIQHCEDFLEKQA